MPGAELQLSLESSGIKKRERCVIRAAVMRLKHRTRGAVGVGLLSV